MIQIHFCNQERDLLPFPFRRVSIFERTGGPLI
jgi:hypothetical protein